jgi:hypothetical protein
MYRHAVWQIDTNDAQKPADTIFKNLRRHVPPKRRYMPTKLHGVTSQKTVIFTGVEANSFSVKVREYSHIRETGPQRNLLECQSYTRVANFLFCFGLDVRLLHNTPYMKHKKVGNVL